MAKYIEKLIDIRKQGEQSYKLEILGFKIELPLCEVSDDINIVTNEPLCFGSNISFNEKASTELASRISIFQPDVILTAEAKAIALAYEVSRKLKLGRYVLARKTKKRCMQNTIKTEVTSITSGKKDFLFLDGSDSDYLKDKNVALLDDVISTGETMKGLTRLVLNSGGAVCVLSSVWLEGHWPFDVFSEEFSRNEVVFLGILPVFASEAKYDQLLAEKQRVEEKGLCQNIRALKLL